MEAQQDPPDMHPDTVAAQALGWIDEATRAITPPIHVSSTYLRDADNQYRSGRVYARADNPAFDQAEAVHAARSRSGQQTLLFASGMAAATAVFQALAPGDHVLAPQVMYWSLRNWLMSFAVALGPGGRAGRHDRARPRCRPRCARAGRGWCGSRRRPIRCGR